MVESFVWLIELQQRIADIAVDSRHDLRPASSHTQPRNKPFNALQTPPPAGTPCTFTYTASRTRCNQFNAARALACARRFNDVTRCNIIDMLPCGPLCANTMSSINRKYITYRNVAIGEPRHGHSSHAQNVGEDGTYLSSTDILADTDKQTLITTLRHS